MKVITKYVANNGIEFATEKECVEQDNSLNNNYMANKSDEPLFSIEIFGTWNAIIKYKGIALVQTEGDNCIEQQQYIDEIDDLEPIIKTIERAMNSLKKQMDTFIDNEFFNY